MKLQTTITEKNKERNDEVIKTIWNKISQSIDLEHLKFPIFHNQIMFTPNNYRQMKNHYFQNLTRYLMKQVCKDS